MNRRAFNSGLMTLACSTTALTCLGSSARSGAGPSREQSIAAWEDRIGGIIARGRLPIIDMQATYIAGRTNVSRIIEHMNELDVAQIAFAAASAPTSEPSLELHRQHPEFFIPTTNSGEFARWWKKPRRFVSRVAKDLDTGSYFLMGEHEFRHYPSPEQVKAGRTDRDITVGLDTPAGHALFELSETHGVAFQIHYEIEDRLLPALEAMLGTYPDARVIWCHLAMIRYPDRATGYTPEYVTSLIERFPGLHFDLAVPPADAVYGPSGARQSTLYAPSGEIDGEWRAILENHPERFLAASDYRPDVEGQYAATIRRQRRMVESLSSKAQKLIAYENAWRLVTGSPWSG